MILSMHIIEDELKDYQPTSNILSNDLNISSVRLHVPGDATRFNTVYIAKSHDIFQDQSDLIILLHEDEWIRLQTNQTYPVMNRLLTLLETFAEWNQKMLQLVSSSSMTQDIIDCSTPFIQAPIFLVDSGQRVLSISQNFPRGTVDHLWDEMLDGGSANIDFLSRVHLDVKVSSQIQDVQYIDNEAFPHPIYQRNFFVQDNLVGQACLVDLDGSITPGNIQKFQLMCDNLNLWFQANIQVHEHLQLQLLLKKAITDPTADNSELIWQLQLLGWRETDQLVLLKMDAPYQPYSINEHLCRSINKRLTDTIAVSLNFSVFALCNTSKLPLDVYRHSLESLLMTSKYYGVYSEKFTLKDPFYVNHDLVLIASEFCEKVVGQLYDGAEFLHYYIFHEIRKHVDPEQLHPVLKQLKDYDESHNSDLYYTLKTFLENERSPLATAKALQIHRNSLSYRLEKLKELVQVDLDDKDVRLYLTLSFALDNINIKEVS